jgi:hypothetical protein
MIYVGATTPTVQIKQADAGPRTITVWTATGTLTANYSAIAFSRHHARAISQMREYHGSSRLAALMLLSTIITELDAGGDQRVGQAQPALKR